MLSRGQVCDARNGVVSIATAVGNLQFELEELYKKQDSVRLLHVLQMVEETYKFVLSERDIAIAAINKAGE
jgi:hypothetical protein